MDTKKIIASSDDEVSESDIELIDLELEALQGKKKAAESAKRMAENDEKIAETKSRRLRMQRRSKQSNKKGTRPTEQSGVGEVALGRRTGDRMQDQDDDKSGRKRIKLEPAHEGVAAARNLVTIDLTRATPPVEQPANRPVRIARVDYTSDPDSDSEPAAAQLNNLEDRPVEKAGRKHRYKSYNEAFPTVCEMPDGRLAQLHCSVCKSNATFRDREIQILLPGSSLQTHYTSSHRDFCKAFKLTGKDLMEESVVAYLSNEEVEAVRDRQTGSYKVEVVLTKRAQMEYDLRNPLEERSKQSPKDVVTPTLSTERDEDDEEEEVKLPGRRGVAALSGRVSENINSATSTGKFAKKSAPGGGFQASMWRH